MSDWRETTLGDVCELKRGYDLPRGSRTNGSVPVISSSGPTGWHDEAKVQAPGVVTGRYGTLGQVFYVTEDFWPLNTSLYVRDFKGNDPQFIAALLRSLDLAKYDGAAAVPGLNRNHLHTLPVRVPGIAVQQTIARVAQAFDDLIVNNQRRVEVLEEISRAIYREWFVKFRYPGHVDVPLVDSPLGPIPAGWSVRRLAECCDLFVDGDWVETKDQGGSDYRLLQVSNVGLGSFRETGAFRYITQETFDRLRCTAVETGDLLISRMPDPVGRTWLVDHLEEPAITVVDVTLARAASKAIGNYLSQVLNAREQLAHAETVATGTTRKRISRRVLGQLAVRMPSNDLLERFHQITEGSASLVTLLRRENDRIGRLRDLLLPKLVTGQIDVSSLDVDALVSTNSTAGVGVA